MEVRAWIREIPSLGEIWPEYHVWYLGPEKSYLTKFEIPRLAGSWVQPREDWVLSSEGGGLAWTRSGSSRGLPSGKRTGFMLRTTGLPVPTVALGNDGAFGEPTVGIGPRPVSVDARDFLDSLAVYARFAHRVGWLDDDSVAARLQDLITEAAEPLAVFDTLEALRRLDVIIAWLEDERKHLGPLGHPLLSLNVRYLAAMLNRSHGTSVRAKLTREPASGDFVYTYTVTTSGDLAPALERFEVWTEAPVSHAIGPGRNWSTAADRFGRLIRWAKKFGDTDRETELQFQLRSPGRPAIATAVVNGVLQASTIGPSTYADPGHYENIGNMLAAIRAATLAGWIKDSLLAGNLAGPISRARTGRDAMARLDSVSQLIEASDADELVDEIRVVLRDFIDVEVTRGKVGQPRLRAAVRRDSVDRWVYTYELTQTPNSERMIHSFSVESGAPPIEVGLPSSEWESRYRTAAGAQVWSRMGETWVSRPDSSATYLFEIASHQPPAVVRGAMLDYRYTFAPTIGPRWPAGRYSVEDQMDSLWAYAGRAKSLAWARDDSTIEVMFTMIDSARSAFSGRDTMATTRVVERILSVLTIERDRSLSSEGYALLNETASWIWELLQRASYEDYVDPWEEEVNRRTRERPILAVATLRHDGILVPWAVFQDGTFVPIREMWRVDHNAVPNWYLQTEGGNVVLVSTGAMLTFDATCQEYGSGLISSYKPGSYLNWHSCPPPRFGIGLSWDERYIQFAEVEGTERETLVKAMEDMLAEKVRSKLAIDASASSVDIDEWGFRGFKTVERIDGAYLFLINGWEQEPFCASLEGWIIDRRGSQTFVETQFFSSDCDFKGSASITPTAAFQIDGRTFITAEIGGWESTANQIYELVGDRFIPLLKEGAASSG
ncbi:MAG TPA: hypothetical protein VGA18_07390 [Rhodothermales bacterium]